MSETWHIEMRCTDTGMAGRDAEDKVIPFLEPFTVGVQRDLPDYLLATMLNGKYRLAIKGRVGLVDPPMIDFVERRIVMNVELWGVA